MPAPNLVSRAVRKLRPTPEEAPTFQHPLVAAYHDPEYVPQQDGVTVRQLTPDAAARYGRQLSDAQREGIRAELEIRKAQQR